MVGVLDAVELVQLLLESHVSDDVAGAGLGIEVLLVRFCHRASDDGGENDGA
jgi:hypothetical protein